jgi:hypothetical protein
MTETHVLFPFPRSLNIKLWKNYLNRELFPEEHNIIENVRHEKCFNDEITKLHNIAKLKGYYVSKLTNLHGNCLFESFEFLNICENTDYMRHGIAHLMLMFRDYKGIIQGDTRTIEELFNDTNEIEHILCRNEDRAYKYNYYAMCQDLASDFSWTRLPTQLIMIFMSKIFNIKINIVSNLSEYINVINANSDYDHPTEISLGHIGESHYVPLMTRTDELDDNELYHQEYKTKFINWAHAMEQSINMQHNTRNNITQDNNTQDDNTIQNDKKSITIGKKEYSEKTYTDVTHNVQATDENGHVNYD